MGLTVLSLKCFWESLAEYRGYLRCLLASFSSGVSPNTKITWSLPPVCCLLSLGDVGSSVCVYNRRSLLVLNCVCEFQICLLRVRELGKNEVIVHNKSPICFSSALQPTRETFRRGLFYNLHSYCQNWEMKQRYIMRNAFFILNGKKKKKKNEILLPGKKIWGSLNQPYLKEVRPEVKAKENLSIIYVLLLYAASVRYSRC